MDGLGWVASVAQMAVQDSDIFISENKSRELEIFWLQILRYAGVLCHEPLQCFHAVFDVNQGYRAATSADV